MCPDSELLSAWTDGEVPSPWRERIAGHVEGCASCATRVDDFRRVSILLQAASPDEGPVVDRIRDRLAARGMTRAPTRPRFRPFPGGLTLPLPLAAAAALALMLIGGLSGGFLRGGSSLARGGSAAPVPTGASSTTAPSMDSLVRYFEAQNAQVSVTIQLPRTASFSSGGEPMIVKTPPVETVSWPASDPSFAIPPSGGSGK